MQFSLPEIREFSGYTEEETAEYYNLPLEKIREIAEDPGKMTASMVIKWRKLHGIPIDYIKIDKEKDR